MTKFFAVKSYERIWVQIVGKSLKTIPQHNLPNTPFYVSNTFRGLYNYCCIVRTDKTLLTVSILLELYKSPGWTDQYLHWKQCQVHLTICAFPNSLTTTRWRKRGKMSFLYFFFVSDSLTTLSLCFRVLYSAFGRRFIPVFLLFYADPIPSIMSRMLSFLFIDTLHN